MIQLGSYFAKKIWGKEVKIPKNEVKAGDHIYSWRRNAASVFAHHGIYVGDGIVIHFTNWGRNNHCRKCGDQSNQCGVISSCLDCFLEGGILYRFEYSVSKDVFMARPAGTCTTAPTDPPEEVLHRARYLFDSNGFGVYHALENNCEDFAIYCKTSLIVGKNYLLGRSGQANTVSVAQVISGLTGLPFLWNVSQLHADIGIRKDVTKVPVEILVARGR